MDTKKLRQKILDLAIHGKLVPQDPNDEPASVLLERIRAEKEQLIKEGKIKAPKKSKTAGDTSHYGKEGPWELPERWVWTTLGSICSIKGGKRIPKGKTFSKDKTAHVYIRVTDMKNGTVDMSDLKYIDEDVYEEIRRYIIEKNDLYLTIAGTIGKVGEIPDALHGMNLTENAARLTEIVCDKRYLMYSLMTDMAQSHFSLRFHQVAQPKLSIETSSSTPVAIPPLAEQKRIVKAIENYFNCFRLLDLKLAALEADVMNAKKLILDLAIHGKLVPQDPSDEPAIELLRRVKPAFQPSHNLHYEGDLPNGWCLTQLKDVAVYGDTSNIDVSSINSDRWILELEDIEKDTARIINIKTKADREVSGVRHSFKKGQILYSKLRTYLNKVLIAPDDGICTTEIVPVTACRAILPDYLLMVMRSSYFLEYSASCCHGVKMPRLGTIDAQKAVVPLPPIAEQARIVEKISELMTVLSSL